MRVLNTLVILCMLLLPGCISPYDAHEYQKFITLLTLVDKHDCSPDSINKILYESEYLVRYSSHKPNETEIITATYQINQSLMQIENRLMAGESVSPKYCEFKMENLSIIIGAYAYVLGKKSP